MAGSREIITSYKLLQEALTPKKEQEKTLLKTEEIKEVISDHIDTIQKIKDEGLFLGNGFYGEAYKIGGKVYKIYKKQYDEHVPFDEKKGEEAVRCAQRSAEYWNEVYRDIHGGKYARFAIAEYRTIENSDVLIIPYIDGVVEQFLTNADRAQFREVLDKLSLGMWDWDMGGNVKKIGSEQLPVDFDAFYRCPKRKHQVSGSFSFFYEKDLDDEEPLSPASRYWFACATDPEFVVSLHTKTIL